MHAVAHKLHRSDWLNLHKTVTVSYSIFKDTFVDNLASLVTNHKLHCVLTFHKDKCHKPQTEVAVTTSVTELIEQQQLRIRWHGVSHFFSAQA